MPRYVSNPNPPHNWIPEEEYREMVGERKGPLVFGDLPDVVSPIDGTVIHGRAGFRDHFKRHKVTWADDFREEWKKPRQKDLRDKQDRTERLKNAWDKHSRR